MQRVPWLPRARCPEVYSRECFEAIGGIDERLGWDTIDETYARLRGFTTRSFDGLVARHHRPVGTADGTLRGRARHGQCAYILHYGGLGRPCVVKVDEDPGRRGSSAPPSSLATCARPPVAGRASTTRIPEARSSELSKE